VRFYTNPRGLVEYPYVMLHMGRYEELFRMRFDHAIVDSGVMIFAKRGVRDYPAWFMKTYARKARVLTEVFGDRVWVVIPDYPDDYNPRQFGGNVGRTVENVERFIGVDGVNWLPVLQARYMDRLSFLESCWMTREVLGEGYPRIAIGTVCKCRKLDFIEYCCRAARKFFPEAWIHAFGLTLSALPRVRGVIDSFDSMAWTFPRGRGGHSAKNKRELIQYFKAYLERVHAITATEVDIRARALRRSEY